MRAPFAFFGPAANPLYAIITPSSTEAVIESPAGTVGSKPVTSVVVTCVAKNGSGIYPSYLWEAVGVTLININSATGRQTTFTGNVTAGSSLTGTFKCTVDDSLGTGPVVATNQIFVTLTHNTLD